VFLSYTSELRRFPVGRSFIGAARKAVTLAGDAIVDTADLSAQANMPAQACEEAVATADVYVLIAGFGYGSPVPDRPAVSYVELEYETAMRLGIPRLVFLLSDEAEGPREMIRDIEYGVRQEVFRSRVLDSGITSGR
jgi:hypothetical protein